MTRQERLKEYEIQWPQLRCQERPKQEQRERRTWIAEFGGEYPSMEDDPGQLVTTQLLLQSQQEWHPDQEQTDLVEIYKLEREEMREKLGYTKQLSRRTRANC
jgi:hypothetical protein